ncbi:MAG TPA: TrpB-like pyridoxal phosphate-dependent enzyme [Syntrophomonadaceae bacterium]|nr:TrpB-like pyridoxal phosphate-dependent enzyme [Syntrophomonadaceae bacterium]HQE23858.1 TrpB-like pyridoxal phosphate-dependent enzyme [Syntrophomonadaceae bacterium]
MSREPFTKIMLPEDKIPKFWYNVQADMPNLPVPGLHPQTKQPLTPADLEPIFARELIAQEVSTERYIEIPAEVRQLYKQYRPSPLFRARQLEKALDTPCRIYYKYEGVSPVGSHKLNSALPQAFFNKIQGIKRLTTETGAGQWGTALSLACRHFGIEAMVYMVKISFTQKPYRRSIMELYGATCVASPSTLTESGRRELAKDPNTPGTLAMAISEAVEDAAQRDDTNYSLGSVLNHVCLHQTIIGQEARLQLEMVDDYPDMVIGCCGGGSNFAGIAFPFLPDKLAGKNIRLIAVEPAACPTLTKGEFTYDYGDAAGLVPIMKMYTLGHNFTPSGIHAGGLRYHGASPLVSQLYHDGLLEAVAVKQNATFAAAMLFARTESIVPAPESAHAIRVAVDEALKAKEEGISRTILFNLSGHGHLDLFSYDRYLSGETEDVEFSCEDLQVSLQDLPQI